MKVIPETRHDLQVFGRRNKIKGPKQENQHQLRSPTPEGGGP
jgi:hypothetical protein